MWFLMILVIAVMALFGEIIYVNKPNYFLFDIRLKSNSPKFDVSIFKIMSITRLE